MRIQAWDEVIELDDGDIEWVEVEDETAMMEAWFAAGDRASDDGWAQSFETIEADLSPAGDGSSLGRARNRVSILFPFMPRASAA